VQLMTASKISISAQINSQQLFHITNMLFVRLILRNAEAKEGPFLQSKLIKR
jgi:hypothetical protein